METLRFIIFFLVCYFFTKKAASLLPNKKTWIFSLKVLLIVNVAWCLLSSLGNFLAYSFAWYDYKNLCKTTVFMTLRFSGEVITGVFAAIGAIITRQIYRIPSYTQYELRVKRKQQKAIKRLWIVIGTFIFVSLSLCVYDFIGFASTDCRVIVPDSQVGNDLLWYYMRSMGYQMWAIPLIYVFWPVGRRRESMISTVTVSRE